MRNTFSQNISPFVRAELDLAKKATKEGRANVAFVHLENAHVLGQESTYWHVKVHVLMFLWGIRERQIKEVIGQILRIVGAATKTAFGLVPQGNTGGVNISPFKSLAIKPEHADILLKVKKSVSK